MARLAYLGTPEMAVPPLRALAVAGHDVALCVTRPDRRRGRGGRVTPSPVRAAATELGIRVTDDMDAVADVGADLAVVVAYGRIIPARLLEHLLMVNLHFSLLPRWRGAAPVERAILAGDTETGVCLMKVDEGLDTGPVYATRTIALDDGVTLSALRARLVDVGSALLVEALAGGVAGLPEPHGQVGEPTVAAKLTPEELRLDWSGPATHLVRVVRLERAWTTFRGGRLRVLEAMATAPDPALAGLPPGTLHGSAVATGEGVVALRRVQPESRSPLSADAWLRGAHLAPGDRLGTD